MSVTPSVGTGLALVPHGSASNSIDVGTNPEFLVVLIGAGGNNDLQFFATVTIGGQTLSYITQAAFIGRNMYLYELAAPAAMSGSQTFQVALTGSFNGYAIPYALHGGGAGVNRLGGVGGGGGASVGMNVDLDSGAATALGIVGGRMDSGGHSPLSGTTEDFDAGGSLFSHETVAGTGSRTVGHNVTNAGARLGMLYEAVSIDLGGGRNGLGMGVRAGALSYEGELKLSKSSRARLGMGVRHGTFTFTAKRQVALVGNGIETPEMTVGGTEGQVLTQHAAEPPTWEDPAGGAGTVDQLNDIGDVDVPMPGDGDVVAWDDYQQLWVAVPVGSLTVDEITDLPTAETDTSLVLAPDGAGGVEWVTPAAGGGDVPPALKVVMYERFS